MSFAATGLSAHKQRKTASSVLKNVLYITRLLNDYSKKLGLNGLFVSNTFDFVKHSLSIIKPLGPGFLPLRPGIGYSIPNEPTR
jgi:hypothetical protein